MAAAQLLSPKFVSYYGKSVHGMSEWSAGQSLGTTSTSRYYSDILPFATGDDELLDR